MYSVESRFYVLTFYICSYGAFILHSLVKPPEEKRNPVTTIFLRGLMKNVKLGFHYMSYKIILMSDIIIF